MAIIEKIYLPKETVSDDFYKISRVFVNSESKVKVGDLILAADTSKASFEIQVGFDGTLVHQLKENTDVKVGELVAVLVDGDVKEGYTVLNEAKKPGLNLNWEASATANFSEPALALARELGLDLALFEHLPLVRTKDVQEYADRSKSKPKFEHRFQPNDVVIIGGGGHSKMCIDVLRQNSRYNLVGIVDTILPTGTEILDTPIIGNNDDLKAFREAGLKLLVNGVGGGADPSARERVFHRFKEMGFAFLTLIHPKAIVEPSARLGEGVQVMMGAMVGSNVEVHENSVINSGAIISHDCMIGKHTHITPGAVLGGTVSVGTNCLVGMGSTIFLKVKLGSNVVINNGVNVFKDVPSNAILRQDY